MTKDEFFLKKSISLADRLLPAFDSKSGIPYSSINLKTGITGSYDWSSNRAILAELGSLQLEFTYLSNRSSNPIYAKKVLAIYENLLRKMPEDKLFSTFINVEDGRMGTPKTVTVGALADSFYEYLLKYWLITKQSSDIGDIYYEVIEAIIDRLGVQFKDNGEEYWYFGEKYKSEFKHKFDHLACFIGGTLALGSQYTKNQDIKEKHMRIAKGVANFCWKMYSMNPTGLPCEVVYINNNQVLPPPHNTRYWLMRPEAVETWFILYRLTNDTKYQEWGWKFFQSIEKYSKSAWGYTGLRDATSESPQPDDVQQSFFLSETLKYLYLLFSPPDLVPLDKYVFNTEAHPLSKFDHKWNLKP